MDFYYYNLNSRMDHDWFLSKILTFNKYKELNIGCDKIRFYKCPIIENGGWHLSYFGDEKFIKNKIENFTHQEYNTIEFTDKEKIHDRIKNKKDLFDRSSSINNITVKNNDNLPPYYELYLTDFYSHNPLIKNIEKSLANTDKYTSNITDEILNIHGMSGKKTRHFYNNI